MCYCAQNLHIRIISQWSCDTKDWRWKKKEILIPDVKWTIELINAIILMFGFYFDFFFFFFVILMEQVKGWKLKISGFSPGIHLKTHKINKSPLYNHTKALLQYFAHANLGLPLIHPLVLWKIIHMEIIVFCHQNHS